MANQLEPAILTHFSNSVPELVCPQEKEVTDPKEARQHLVDWTNGLTTLATTLSRSTHTPAVN
jgi:hypothetical protein